MLSIKQQPCPLPLVNTQFCRTGRTRSIMKQSFVTDGATTRYCTSRSKLFSTMAPKGRMFHFNIWVALIKWGVWQSSFKTFHYLHSREFSFRGNLICTFSCSSHISGYSHLQHLGKKRCFKRCLSTVIVKEGSAYFKKQTQITPPGTSLVTVPSPVHLPLLKS